jgi:hypothetical protein
MIRELSGLGENGIIDDAPPFSYGHEVTAAQIVRLRFANPTGAAATACPGRPRIVSCRGARLEWSGGDNIFHKRCDGLMVGWHVKQWWVWARLGCKMLLAAEMSIRRDMYHGQ